MRVLVTGGSGSGKSRFAEGLCHRFGTPLVYIATMQPFGQDAAARIERHRAQRAGAGFVTVERFGAYGALDLASAVEQSLAARRVAGDATGLADGAGASTVLLECAGNVCANLQFSQDGQGGWVVLDDARELAGRVLEGVRAIGSQCANLVVVSNEVGADGSSYATETKVYQRALGRANCLMAAEFDAVFEVAAGWAQALKLGEGSPEWMDA